MFITQFHPGFNQQNGINKTASKILLISSETKYLSNRPLNVNLRNLKILKTSVHSKTSYQNKNNNTRKAKCEPCSQSRCILCKTKLPSKSFKSSVTQK